MRVGRLRTLYSHFVTGFVTFSHLMWILQQFSVQSYQTIAHKRMWTRRYWTRDSCINIIITFGFSPPVVIMLITSACGRHDSMAAGSAGHLACGDRVVNVTSGVVVLWKNSEKYLRLIMTVLQAVQLWLDNLRNDEWMNKRKKDATKTHE